MKKIINNQADFDKWTSIANEYIQKEFSLVGIGLDKKPLFNWKDYQTKRASIEEVKEWFKQPNFRGLAAVTGRISGGLAVLDIDNGANINGFKIPKSPTVLTGNNGYHVYFKFGDSQTLGCFIGFKKKMDFKGEGGLIILPPSVHPNGNIYRWAKDRDLSIPFANIPGWLAEELKRAKTSNFDPKVLRGVGEGERNTSAAQVIGKVLRYFPEEEWDTTVLPIILGWNLQNRPPLSEQELLNVYYGICKNEKAQRKEKGWKENSSEKNKPENSFKTFAIAPLGVIDILDDNGKLVYLTKDGVKPFIQDPENPAQVFVPPPKEQCPYYFAQKDKVLELIKNWKEEDNSKLFSDLISYHKSISDLPDDDYFHILALWDIHSWLIEKCHYSPMLYFYAVKERGKSRTIRGILYVSMRGIFTETVREADIIRWANDHRSAIGFDVKDAANKIKYANCDDLFLSRFEKGGTASRTLYPDRGAFADTKIFKLFGPTIIASNRPVDDILESRSIAIDMKPTSKKFNDPVLPENALELKNRLSAFRFVHFEKDLIKTDKPANGRLGDILSPLYQILLTFFPENKDTFLRLLKKLEKRKSEEATETYEAKIIESVLRLKNQVKNGKLSVDEITDDFNIINKTVLKNRTVGTILSALGFTKIRMTGGKGGIFYHAALIEKLCLQYGISEESEDSDDISEDADDFSEQLRADM